MKREEKQLIRVAQLLMLNQWMKRPQQKVHQVFKLLDAPCTMLQVLLQQYCIVRYVQ